MRGTLFATTNFTVHHRPFQMVERHRGTVVQTVQLNTAISMWHLTMAARRMWKTYSIAVSPINAIDACVPYTSELRTQLHPTFHTGIAATGHTTWHLQATACRSDALATHVQQNRNIYCKRRLSHSLNHSLAGTRAATQPHAFVAVGMQLSMPQNTT
jgi:hypothetical protein